MKRSKETWIISKVKHYWAFCSKTTRGLSAIGPFHFISTPPLWKRSIKIYPLRIKDQKCRHVPPIRNCLNFLFPSEKRQFFSKPPGKYLKDQRRRRSDPLRNDVQGPPQKISSIGGVWILNGMAHFEKYLSRA